MSLQGLKIPAHIIGKLYKEVFVTDVQTSVQVKNASEIILPEVDLPNGTALTEIKPQLIDAQKQLVYLGNNQQHIAILVNYPNDKHIAEAPLELLSKMLAACQLNLGSVAIINTAHQSLNYQILQEQLQSKIVIMFGMNASAIALPMQFPLYKDQVFANTLYLQSDSLNDMLPNTNESKVLKTSLWSSFKRIFNL